MNGNALMDDQFTECKCMELTCYHALTKCLQKEVVIDTWVTIYFFQRSSLFFGERNNVVKKLQILHRLQNQDEGQAGLGTLRI